MNIDTLIAKLKESGTSEPKLVRIREIYAVVQRFDDVFIEEIRNWLNPVTAAKAQAFVVELTAEVAAKEKADKDKK